MNAGQNVTYQTNLASTGRSGTGFAHLHQAETNQGEHTTDRKHYVTIPFPSCNYEYSENSGVTWQNVIWGHLKTGQWARNPALKAPIRYIAVWSPNDGGEFKIYDAS